MLPTSTLTTTEPYIPNEMICHVLRWLGFIRGIWFDKSKDWQIYSEGRRVLDQPISPQCIESIIRATIPTNCPVSLRRHHKNELNQILLCLLHWNRTQHSKEWYDSEKIELGDCLQSSAMERRWSQSSVLSVATPFLHLRIHLRLFYRRVKWGVRCDNIPRSILCEAIFISTTRLPRRPSKGSLVLAIEKIVPLLISFLVL